MSTLVGKFPVCVLQNKINEHLGRHGLISESQHRFVKNKSSLTNLIEPFEELSVELKGMWWNVKYHILRGKDNGRNDKAEIWERRDMHQ